MAKVKTGWERLIKELDKVKFPKAPRAPKEPKK